jgi:hypothetical protein
MAEYIKKVAEIIGESGGFSTDGKRLFGLVKAQTYAGRLKVEICPINFAPLTEGTYIFGITDGKDIVLFESAIYEGQSNIDISRGFATAICFNHGGIKLIATAICGDEYDYIKNIVDKIEKYEKTAITPNIYNDEAISEVNYYELAPVKSGDNLCQSQEQKDDSSTCTYEENTRPVQSDEKGEQLSADFFMDMKGDIDDILNGYPTNFELEEVIANSRWVDVKHKGANTYAFGVIFEGSTPHYICYGIPSDDAATPPKQLEGVAKFIATNADNKLGYWIMYQSAIDGQVLHN